MKKSGYPAAFSAAVIETASVMGPIIPPSIPMIIYAVLAEVSVGGMFLAGIIPGLMVAAFLALLIYVISLRAEFPRQPRAAIRERVSASADAILALLSPVIIVGGILGGVFTATEAGAVAALYVFLIGALIYRELTLRQIAAALVRSAKGTATVLVILGASSLFAWILADQQISRKAATFVAEAGAPDWIVLIGINLFFFLIGMFLDPLAALIILVPIFLPIGVELGMDPIHFGVMTVINLMIGLCTPPVGYLIYMTADIAGESPWKVIVQSLPFLAALVAVLALTAAFPAITLFLPRLFLG
jgi:tripartite ATP-independent transporter DctM subunit